MAIKAMAVVEAKKKKRNLCALKISHTCGQARTGAMQGIGNNVVLRQLRNNKRENDTTLHRSPHIDGPSYPVDVSHTLLSVAKCRQGEVYLRLFRLDPQ